MARKILCTKTSDLFTQTTAFNGFVTAAMYRMPQLAKDGAHFREKDEAEKNPDYKQLIPYVLIRCPELAGFLTYVRGKSGDEGRLHDMYSAGIGGHIETFDMHSGDALSWVVTRAMRRELKEEINLLGDRGYCNLIGYVNDESQLVNQVHLGLVHLLDVTRSEAKEIEANRSEDCIEQPEFVKLDEIMQHVGEFETWSQHVLSAMARFPYLYCMPPCPL